jgi:hypothetical protein
MPRAKSSCRWSSSRDGLSHQATQAELKRDGPLCDWGPPLSVTSACGSAIWPEPNAATSTPSGLRSCGRRQRRCSSMRTAYSSASSASSAQASAQMLAIGSTRPAWGSITSLWPSRTLANSARATRRSWGAQPWSRTRPHHQRYLHQFLRSGRHRLGVVRHAAAVGADSPSLGRDAERDRMDHAGRNALQ